MGVTKYILKHPVTTVMALLCLVVFGISSVFSAKLEQMPDMETPMLIIMANYSGAGPEDISELVTEPIEEAIGTMEGVDTISSTSSDGRSMIMLQYDYGTDMDEAYDNLKQKLDNIQRALPDDVEPSVMSMNSNQGDSMMLSIAHKTQTNLYDYVDQKIVPELERISSIANIETRGGSSKYVSIELQSEKMDQYNLTMQDVASAISDANVASPSGEADAGNLELSVTTSLKTEQVNELRDIPIKTPAGQIISLSDVANVYEATKDRGGISRYNGQETISISIQKQQDSTDMEVSSAVKEKVEELMADDSDLTITVANDTSDTILDSLKDVEETMILAVIISMFIIFLFFGDYKASLIVGSSIPTSILMSLIAITMAGFSLNVITMSALVLGVGMMVDNSIVVLESCFRATAEQEDKGALGYFSAALHGTGIVINSIIGSTITTCVVFLPLAFLNGMTGQMFKPLGFTIVFCMSASLLSAMTVVPLCYLFYKPSEAKRALMGRPIERLQKWYRGIMDRLLNHKAMVMGFSVLVLVLTVILASGMQTELMTSDDTGTVSVSIETRPGLKQEKIEEALLAEGYFSLAVPMPYEWQDYMRTYCEEYGCPYPLALAVAQTESNFDMDAVGASGEVGIMQLNPGPGGSYHAEIQAATGLDPTTTSGNIAGGCYKLGLYLAKYGNVEKAAMAYNMGEGGARSAWDSGITSTDYSKAVKEAMETWECTVNAWGGV